MRKLLSVLVGLILLIFIGYIKNISGNNKTVEVNSNTEYINSIIGDEKTAERLSIY